MSEPKLPTNNDSDGFREQSMNPFATPQAIERRPNFEAESESSGASGRASVESINQLIFYMKLSEIMYIILWMAFWFSTFAASLRVVFQFDVLIPAGSWNLFMTYFWFACLLVTWYVYVQMIAKIDESLLTFGLSVVFPIPIVGSLAFFASKRLAADFLLWNGYSPKFFGAEPDATERKKMADDPAYFPSAHRNHHGGKRKQVWTISEVFVGLFGLLGVIVPTMSF